MKLLSLQDNAIFLENWRERTRLATASSAFLLAFIIVLLIFTNAFLNETYVYEYKYHPTGETYSVETIRKPVPWLNEAFWQLAIFQGFILILFGTLSADRMAIRENSSGTLDFHRSSPTPFVSQFLGLLLGAPSLEWCVFLSTLVLSGVLVAFTSITFLDFIRFYFALIMTTLLFHTLAILLAVSASQRRILSHRRFGAVQLLVGMFVFSGIFLEGMGLSAFYHLTWYPAYDHLSETIRGSSIIGYGACTDQKAKIMYSFFGYPISTYVLQSMAQLPLLLIFFIGIIRKLKNPLRPVFSKFHTMMLALILLFLFVGSAYTVLIYGTGNYSAYATPLHDVLPIFICLYIALGVIGCLSATPTKLQFLKGLIRNQKLGQKINLNDDLSSNLLWLFTYCIVFTGMYYVLGFTFLASAVEKVLCLAILLCYLVFFAAGLEYFRLGRHRKQMPLFWTGLATLWIILPMFAAIISSSTGATQKIYFALVSPSPFYTMDLLVRILAGDRFYGTQICGIAGGSLPKGCFGLINVNLCTVLAVNAVLAGVAVLLAWQVRRRAKSESLTGFPSQGQE